MHLAGNPAINAAALVFWWSGGWRGGGGVGPEIWGAETLLWGQGKGGHVPCVSLTQLCVSEGTAALQGCREPG